MIQLFQAAACFFSDNEYAYPSIPCLPNYYVAATFNKELEREGRLFGKKMDWPVQIPTQFAAPVLNILHYTYCSEIMNIMKDTYAHQPVEDERLSLQRRKSIKVLWCRNTITVNHRVQPFRCFQHFLSRGWGKMNSAHSQGANRKITMRRESWALTVLELYIQGSFWSFTRVQVALCWGGALRLDRNRCNQRCWLPAGDIVFCGRLAGSLTSTAAGTNISSWLTRRTWLLNSTFKKMKSSINISCSNELQ